MHRSWAVAATVALIAGLVTATAGTSSAQTVRCFGRAATIVVTAAGQVTNGTPGDDVIVGTAGADIINGRGGNDRICSRGGSDTVRGNGGADRINAGGGSDLVLGGGGADLVKAGAGADDVRGGKGADDIRGGGGNDVLNGQGGNDSINGGRGFDTCNRGGSAGTLSSCNEVPANPGDSVNCSDFATYADAKSWFDLYFPHYGDIARLDANDDGIPCESLAGAPS